MPLFVLVIICAWLAVVAFAVMLCLAARRTDEEVAGTDLAPVIDVHAARSRRAGTSPDPRSPRGVTSRPDPVLVHDYPLVMREAERTFAAMADCWPQAPVRKLKVVGTGPDLARLQREYTGCAEFLGRVSDAELRDTPIRGLARGAVG